MQPKGLENYFITKGLLQRKPRTVKWFHRVIFKALMQLMIGTLPNGAKNLGICIPPRHGKTMIAQDFIEYALGLFPDAKFIYTGYNLDIACESSRAILNSLKSDWYKEIFAHDVVNKKCRMCEDKFDTAKGGGLKAAGVNGPLTGFGAGQKREGFAGAIIIDDALKASDFRSETVRNSCNRWYTETLSSRTNKDDTPKVIIAQRGHPEDLPGWLEKNEPGLWHWIKIPAIDKDGVVLWPEVKSKASLELLKLIDEFTFFAQYQQEPQKEGGNIIKSDWWKYHNYVPLVPWVECVPGELWEAGKPPQGLLFITADTAYKKTKTADYSSLQLWCASQTHLDLIDKMHGKWEFPDLLKNAKAFYDRWKDYGIKALFIEDKASGTSLEQTLRLQGLPAIAWLPAEYKFPVDKVGRVREASWYIFAGRVRLPAYIDCKGFVEEHSSFAEDMSHSHDDEVDTETMAVSIWRYYGGGSDVQTG